MKDAIIKLSLAFALMPRFGLPAVAPAQDGRPKGLERRFELASKHFDSEQATLVKRRGDSKDLAERRRLADLQVQLASEFARDCLAMAAEDPGGPVAIEALFAACQAEYRGAEVEKALKILREDFAPDPKMAGFCEQLGQLPSALVEPLLREVLEKSRDRPARGQACLALAKWLATRAEVPRDRAQDAVMAKGLERAYGKELLDDLGRRDVAAMSREAEALYERVSREFADVKLLPSDRADRRTIGPVADEWLSARRELAVGKVAPEIVGKNIDGEVFALGDFRGKVVVLVFWASWCGPCMEQVPHERKLAERLVGRPFTILGVNMDYEAAKAREAIAKESISWPNWIDGDPRGLARIANLYHVQSIPVVYVLDQAGVIRHRDLRGEALSKCVDELLDRVPAPR